MLVNLKSWMKGIPWMFSLIEMFQSGIPLGFNGELPSRKIHRSPWKCLTDCLILRYKAVAYQSSSTLGVLWKTSTTMYFHGNWSEESSKVLRISATLYCSVQSLSRVWLCDPMECSTPGLPVHHQLPELTQTHVHWVGDAIQPSHPLSSPSPPALNLSQHQGLFQWVSSLHQVAKVLEFQLQHQSFQWISRTNLL